MKGATMLATLQALGVVPSFSRPAVSNDNPYAQSLFKTLKYRPSYPSRAFESLLAARLWVEAFVHWYNDEHRHSAIRFVTPGQRHAGQDTALLSKRVDVYEAAKAKHPERWSGPTRNWQPVCIVHLNPDQLDSAKFPESFHAAICSTSGGGSWRRYFSMIFVRTGAKAGNAKNPGRVERSA